MQAGTAEAVMSFRPTGVLQVYVQGADRRRGGGKKGPVAFRAVGQSAT